MIKPSEKAYRLALVSLKEKKYSLAAGYFDRAAIDFSHDREFVLLRETTRLLVAVKRKQTSGGERLDIEEVFTNG